MKANESDPSEGVVPVMVGAPGGPVGVRGPDGAEKAPWPMELTAATSNSYATPFVSELTVQVVAVPVHVDAVVQEL